MKYLHRKDGTRWALPVDNLQWLLRYGSDADALRLRLAAAEVISNFASVVFLPTKKRTAVLREMKEALRAADAEDDSPAACDSADATEAQPQTGTGSVGTVAPRSEGSGRSACDERCRGSCRDWHRARGDKHTEQGCQGWTCRGSGPAHNGGIK